MKTIIEAINKLFADLSQQATPALVFYGKDDQRVELSGRVLDNWVAKTANLLTDEYNLGPGGHIVIDPTPHWRTVALAAAIWRIGATAVLWPHGSHQKHIDLHTMIRAQDSLHPEIASTDHHDLMIFAYPALAMELPAEDLPATAYDFCAEIRAYGDLFHPHSTPEVNDWSLLAATEKMTYETLLQKTAEYAQKIRESRTHIRAIYLPQPELRTETLAQLCGIWSAGATAVITDRNRNNSEHLKKVEKIGITWD